MLVLDGVPALSVLATRITLIPSPVCFMLIPKYHIGFHFLYAMGLSLQKSAHFLQTPSTDYAVGECAWRLLHPAHPNRVRYSFYNHCWQVAHLTLMAGVWGTLRIRAVLPAHPYLLRTALLSGQSMLPFFQIFLGKVDLRGRPRAAPPIQINKGSSNHRYNSTIIDYRRICTEGYKCPLLSTRYRGLPIQIFSLI